MKKQRLKIGWASRDITPAQPAVLAGQFYGRIAKKVMDPLSVTALVLENADGSHKAAAVSLDAVYMKAYTWDRIRQCVADKCPDISVSDIFVSGTHTHSAPTQYPSPYPMPEECIGDKEYSDMVADAIAAAVAEAWSKRSEGSVGWGLAHAAIGRNRHACYADGSVQMYGDSSKSNFTGFESGEDSLVQTMFTWDADGELTGAIVNVACPSQCSEHSDYVTADYWADTRSELRARHGNGLYILPQCAAAGDISPHLLALKEAEKRMLKLRGLMDDASDDEDAFRLSRRRDIALRISDAFDESLSAAATDKHDQVEFGHIQRVIDLPRQLVSSEQRAAALAQADEHRAKAAALAADPTEHDYSFHWSQANYYQGVVERYDTQESEPCLAVDVHVLRIGDIALTTNRFELYHEYEIRIRARSRALQTFVAQLTGAGTYLPSRRAMSGNSYGAKITSSQVGPDGGDVLVAETLKALDELFG